MFEILQILALGAQLLTGDTLAPAQSARREPMHSSALATKPAHDLDDVVIVVDPNISPKAVICSDPAPLRSTMLANTLDEAAVMALRDARCRPLANGPYALVDERLLREERDIAEICPIQGGDWTNVRTAYTLFGMLRLQ
jgi:hypothetical protein